MSTIDRKDTKTESTAAEPGVLTEVAEKVGTAVGTVVSALSGTSKAGTGKSSTSKKGQRKNSHPTNAERTTKMTAAKTPKQRSKKKPGSAGADHSPLKRHRIKSK